MYQDIRVLLICWKKARETEFAKQRSILQTTLRDLYGFTVEVVDIPFHEHDPAPFPEHDPASFLTEEIRKLKVDHDKEGNLLIIYYGGHGVVKGGQLFLTRFSTILPGNNVVEWIKVQKPLLSKSQADIFIILDCCFAASATEIHHEAGNNAIDILFASSIEGKAPLSSGNSLTEKLNVALRKLCKEPFRTWYLHRQLLLQQKPSASSRPPDDIGEGYDPETGTTPILCHILSKPTRNRDILIHQRGAGIATPRVDAASNTEHELACVHLKSGCPVQLAPPRAEYIDAFTNTETRVSSSLSLSTQASVEIRPPVKSRRPSSKGLPSVSSLLLQPDPPPRRSRRRKMVAESGETEVSPETRNWLHRYDEWAAVYGIQGEYRAKQDLYKISVLCNGLDAGRTPLSAAYFRHGRISTKDFTGEPEDSADTDGFGTNIVQLLAKMSRSATIFVAKVVSSRQVTREGLGAITAAICHSIHSWKADMIVLPMGIREHHQGIGAAVLEARQHNIIVIAPTGNSGGNERVGFPARMPGVIAVHATDGHGNPSLFNPSPVKGRKNFSTVGELIPARDKGGKQSHLTGTAYAACVAASILSVVIQFARARLQMKEEDLQWLNSPEGAEALLELMSTERGGYNYVAPWLFFSGEIDEEMTYGSEAEFINLIRGQFVAAMRKMR